MTDWGPERSDKRTAKPIYEAYQARDLRQSLRFELDIDQVEQLLLGYLAQRDRAVQPPELDFFLIASTLEMLAHERVLDHFRQHPEHGPIGSIRILGEDDRQQAIILRIRLETFRDWGEAEMAGLIEGNPLEYHRRFRHGHQIFMGPRDDI